MGELLNSFGLLLTGSIAIACVVFLYRLIFGNRGEYERNRKRAGNFLQSLKGQVPPVFDGTRDSRVSAGIAVRNNEWIEQGKLSAEAVASSLRRSK